MKMMKLMIFALAVCSLLTGCFDRNVRAEITDDPRIVGRWKKIQDEGLLYYTFLANGECHFSQHPRQPDIYFQSVTYEFKEGTLIMRLSNNRLHAKNKAEIVEDKENGDRLIIHFGRNRDEFVRIF